MGTWGCKECVWEVWVRRKGWGGLLPQGPGETGVKRKHQEYLWTGTASSREARKPRCQSGLGLTAHTSSAVCLSGSWASPLLSVSCLSP